MQNPWPEHIIGLAKDIQENGRNDGIDGIMADAMYELGLPLVAEHFVDAERKDHKTNKNGTKAFCGFCSSILEGKKMWIMEGGPGYPHSAHKEFNDYIVKVTKQCQPSG